VAAGILPALTYQVNRGNGYYGTTYGELIQIRYPYNVSDPNADHCPTADKADFAAAVAAWQALSDAEKKYWNAKVWRDHRNMSGYNLFIRKYRLGEI
jgi:hypothetical protein